MGREIGLDSGRLKMGFPFETQRHRTPAGDSFYRGGPRLSGS